MTEQTYGPSAAGLIGRMFDGWGEGPPPGPRRTDAGRYVDFITGGEEEGCEIRTSEDLDRCRAEFDRRHAANPKGDAVTLDGRAS